MPYVHHMIDDVSFTLETNPAREHVLFVRQNLLAHDRAVLPPERLHPFVVIARTQEGELVGGIVGRCCYSWLYLDMMWVDPRYRRLGIGRRLMDMGEAEGSRQLCRNALLSTMSEDARDLYARRGYVLFGVLEDHPAGYARYFMRKTLA